MSGRTPAPASDVPGRPSLAAIGAPLQPQVNLLPPEVQSRRALSRAKVGLALALALVLLLTGLGYVYASLAESRAAENLARAEDEVRDLQGQQAQYAEVPQVKEQIATAQQARILSMSTEVLWPDYIRAIQAVTPEGVGIVSFTTDMPSPVVSGSIPASLLEVVGVGGVTFSAQTLTLPDLAGWMDALDSIAGFSDATYTMAELTDDEGIVTYQIAVAARVDQAVFASRFLEEE